MLRMTRWRVVDTLRKRMPIETRDDRDASALGLEKLPDKSGQDFEAIWEAEWEKEMLSMALEEIKPQIKPEHYQILTFM